MLAHQRDLRKQRSEASKSEEGQKKSNENTQETCHESKSKSPIKSARARGKYTALHMLHVQRLGFDIVPRVIQLKFEYKAVKLQVNY